MSDKPRITAAKERETPSVAQASQKGGQRTDDLPPAAQRALAEAEDRRRQLRERAGDQRATKEIGGRGGLDPARYGDWEVKGIASDF
jgi:hypothetical protein